jgi:serine protease
MRSKTASGLGLRPAIIVALAFIAAGFGPHASGGTSPRTSAVFQRQPIDPSLTNRIIVKWRTSGVAAVQMARIEDRAIRLSQVNGIHVAPEHNLYGRTDVMLLDHTPSHREMQQILGRLNVDPGIEYAEPDAIRYLQQQAITTPVDDPHFYPSTDAINASNPDLSIGSWVGQWYLLPSSPATPSAISATTAWQTTAGSPDIVVAVIDTGVILDHPDLAQNLVLPGYDFVSCDEGNFTSTTTTALGATTGLDLCSATGSAGTFDFANDDGQNWHADASDPGDFIDASDGTLQPFISNRCTTEEPSSWHGTKVAGVIAAVANNQIGTVGVAPFTKVLPVRVVGKCAAQARASDIAAAILWAAGQPVTISTGTIQSSPAANIINISLAFPSACTATEQDAINTAINAGVMVVAAAGNEGGPLDAPANCTGVVSVVGLQHTGDKAPLSNLSSDSIAATIAAPGGDCVNTQNTQPCLYDIETTTDAGATVPLTTPTQGFYTYSLLNQSYLNGGGNPGNEANIGTSFASPMVAGVAALMLAANPKLTVAQLTARLQSSALPFPTSSAGSSPKPAQCAVASTAAASTGNFTEPTTPVECICTTSTCGAGMLNAAAALTAATAAFVQIIPSHTSGVPGQKISLNGSASTAAVGYTIVSYQWTTDPPTSDQLINATSPVATLVVPSFRSIGVTLTITDNAGVQTSASITIDSAFGRKGGAFEPIWLVMLSAPALWALYRRRQGVTTLF